MMQDGDEMRANSTSAQLSERFAAQEAEAKAKRGRGRPRKETSINPGKESAIVKNDDRSLFIQGLLSVMASYQAKTPDQIDKCVDGAEHFVDVVREKYPL